MSSKSRVERMEAEANAMISGLNQGNTGEQSTTKQDQGNTDKKPTTEIENHNRSETPVLEQTSQNDTWEQKYRILQGKYNSEMNRLNSEIKRLQSQGADSSQLDSLKREIQSLKDENQNLRQQMSSGSNNGQGDNHNSTDLLNSEFGDDFAAAVEARAQKIAAAEVAKLKSEFGTQVESVNQKFGQYQQESNHSRLQAQLSSAGVNFEHVDSDPLFTDWLQELAPYSSATKHQILIDAYNNGDIKTAAQFYIDYSNQTKPRKQSNPLEQSVSHHQSLDTSDVYSQANTEPSQVGRMIEENERQFQRKQISHEQYDKRNRELFGLLQN